MKLMKILKSNKEGIIIGAVVGFITSKFFFPENVDLNSIFSSSPIDTLKSTTTSSIDWLETKLTWTLTLLGAIIGGYIDSIIPENWLKRRFR